MFNTNTKRKNVEAIDIKPLNLANGLLKVNFLKCLLKIKKNKERRNTRFIKSSITLFYTLQWNRTVVLGILSFPLVKNHLDF